MGDDYACVFWYGDKNKNDNCPIISVKKGNDNIETITYVNRVLIFLYAGMHFIIYIYILFCFILFIFII